MHQTNKSNYNIFRNVAKKCCLLNANLGSGRWYSPTMSKVGYCLRNNTITDLKFLFQIMKTWKLWDSYLAKLLLQTNLSFIIYWHSYLTNPNNLLFSYVKHACFSPTWKAYFFPLICCMNIHIKKHLLSMSKYLYCKVRGQKSTFSLHNKVQIK